MNVNTFVVPLMTASVAVMLPAELMSGETVTAAGDRPVARVPAAVPLAGDVSERSSVHDEGAETD